MRFIEEKKFLKEKLGKITKSERLIVERRRRGNTPKAEAARRKMSIHTYKRFEKRDTYNEINFHGKYFAPLGIFEICHLLRKRAKKTGTVVACEMGVSKGWISLMERGIRPMGALINYWMDQYNDDKA